MKTHSHIVPHLKRRYYDLLLWIKHNDPDFSVEVMVENCHTDQITKAGCATWLNIYYSDWLTNRLVDDDLSTEDFKKLWLGFREKLDECYNT